MTTIDRLIATTPQGSLLGGLLWRAPSAGQSRRRALQEARALTRDATHYAQSRCATQARYGLYLPRASEDGQALPKATFAAAACFARRVGSRAPNAALVLTVAAAGARKEDRHFVVCLEDGVPVVDVLSNEVDARNALGGEDRPIWSDNPVAYPNCEPADFAWLAAAADRQARVQAIPVDPWPIVGAGLVATALGGGWMLVQHVRQLELARQAAQAARAADPVPKYRAALAAQRAQMATDRAALVAAAAGLFDLPARVPGWRLASAECNARLATCTCDWVRRGGSFGDLRQALPRDALEMLVPPGAVVPVLDAARTSRPLRVARTSLLAPGRPLRSLQAAWSDVGDQLQRWRTADIDLEFKPPTLWPRVPDLPTGFRPPDAILAGDASLRGVPGAFILEALRSAPDFVSWESVKVDVGDAGGANDARNLLKFSASGVFYVAAR